MSFAGSIAVVHHLNSSKLKKVRDRENMDSNEKMETLGWLNASRKNMETRYASLYL